MAESQSTLMVVVVPPFASVVKEVFTTNVPPLNETKAGGLTKEQVSVQLIPLGVKSVFTVDVWVTVVSKNRVAVIGTRGGVAAALMTARLQGSEISTVKLKLMV